jgi:hypothetical protein
MSSDPDPADDGAKRCIPAPLLFQPRHGADRQSLRLGTHQHLQGRRHVARRYPLQVHPRVLCNFWRCSSCPTSKRAPRFSMRRCSRSTSAAPPACQCSTCRPDSWSNRRLSFRWLPEYCWHGCGGRISQPVFFFLDAVVLLTLLRNPLTTVFLP